MKKIRMGVFGLGRGASFYNNIKMNGGEIVAVCDRDEKKLAKAKELLYSTNLSIAQIADKLNFECLGQFSTFFRKKVGVPPLEYRKRSSRDI